MWFGILGPLLVADDAGAEIAVAPGRLRVLMATLIARANHVVSVDELAEIVWDGAPPTGAARTVRRYVTRLRATAEPVAARILTRTPGYFLRASEDEVDLLRFERLCREGSAAARTQDWPQAAGFLVQALALWRGSPLEDAASQLLRDATGPRLEQMRLQALEGRIEADLHSGRDTELVPELIALTTEHPLREHAHWQLMLALFRSGRQGEALAAYQEARRVLAGELGVEPVAELRKLNQQILAGDPALAAPWQGGSALAAPGPGSSPGAAAADLAVATPQQLPAANRHFTGRIGALRVLTGLAQQVLSPGSTSTITAAITGTAGVGKTALALHWGQQNAALFPDGQLYVNLRGYDPLGTPVPPAAVLQGLLHTLGIPPERVPADQDIAAALYRSLLAGRRLLVILDNARDSDHVRPLLPGGSGCLVLVTSRSELRGLVALDGAHPVSLDLLTAAEARDLLARRLGAARVRAEPEAVDELTVLCARLPLALNLTAARAIGRPEVPLADLARQLRQGDRSLAALDTGDGAASVRAVFSWSVRNLEADAEHLFRLTALHPGPDLDRYAGAALAGVTASRASDLLAALERANLVQQTSLGRYGMHDLLRSYARELVATDGEVQRAAMARLLDYFLETSAAAMNALFPAERHRQLPVPPAASHVPRLADRTAAQDWLNAERVSLVAAGQYAAEHEWPGHATRLAAAISRYLDTRGHYAEAVALHASAQQAARRTGDHGAEAIALVNLGVAHLRQARYEQASACSAQAQALFLEAGDRIGAARALHNLGLIESGHGRYGEAARYLEQARDLFREAGDRIGETRALGNLGDAMRQQGRHEEAIGYLHQALGRFREAGDRIGESHVLTNLGEAMRQRGRPEQAAGYLHQALELACTAGDRAAEAYILGSLGLIGQPAGLNAADAAMYLQRSLDLFRELGDRTGQRWALSNLNEASVKPGRPVPAS